MLLERDADLAALARVVDAAANGQGAMAMVIGEGGIGKTALLTATAERARALGLRVLEAIGVELEQEYAFGVARQLVGDDGSQVADPLGHIHDLYWQVVDQANDGPLLVVVDDAHWADVSSLRLLAFVARRLDETPIGLVVATREVPEWRPELLTLSDESIATLVRPEPLTSEGVRSLLATHLGAAPDESFTAACWRATGGSPFLLAELITELAAETVTPSAANIGLVERLRPAGVARAVFMGLARLSPQAVAVARELAVVERAELRHVAALSGLDTAATASGVAELEAHRLVAGRPLAFVHPLVRSVIAADVPPAARSQRHLQLARLLEDEGAPRALVAAHLARTEPAADAHTVEVLTDAARDAAANGDPHAAATLLDRARREPPSPAQRAEVLGDLGRHQLSLGWPTCTDVLQEAIEAETDIARRVELALLWSRAMGTANRSPDAVAGLRAVLDTAKAQAPELAPAVALELLAHEVNPSPDAIELIEVAPPEQKAKQAAMQACHLGFAGTARPETVVELATLGTAGDCPPLMSVWWAALGLACVDELDRAAALAAVGDVRARADGLVLDHQMAVGIEADIDFRRGNLASAENLADVALDLADPIAPPGQVDQFALLMLVLTRTLMGDFAGANDTLAHARLDLDGEFDAAAAIHPMTLLAARAELRLAEGDAQAALADAWRADVALAGYRAFVPVAQTVVRALARLGRRDEARARAAQEVARARAAGVPAVLASALRAAALVDEANARALLEESVSAAEASPAKLDFALSLLDLGALMRRTKQRSAAREPLRHALELAHACGAAPVAQRATDELAATGARVTRQRLVGPESLTSSERRVATLAARGATNREIAQELFISMKTVESHLRATYSKLGISSRTALATVLDSV